MFFKIRIKGVDSRTKEDIPDLFVTSLPIKVVSKPEQVARIKQNQGGQKVTKKPRAKKRSLNDMMMESMQKLEKQQAEQKEILQALLAQQTSADGSSLFSSLPQNNLKKAQPTDLEQALQNLLVAYENTDPSERPLKIRKVLGNSTASSVSSFVEISSQLLYNSQRGQDLDNLSFSETTLQNGTTDSTTALSDNLALSEDMERIDDFYRELLLPSSF